MAIFTWDATKPPASSAPVSADIRNNFQALQSGLYGVNLVADPCFEMWGAGDSASPTHYTYTLGTGGTLARAGSGLGDTAVDGSSVGPKGLYCAKLVFGSAQQTLRQQLLDSGGVAFFKGRAVSVGMWVRASAGSAGRISLYDGTGTITTNVSAYHTGNNLWQWLTATMAAGINSSATGLWVYGIQDAGTVYFSAPTVVFGSAPPPDFMPAPVARFTIGPPTTPGAVGVGAYSWRYDCNLPLIVRETRLIIGTAPTGASLIFDLNKAGTTMYTVKPTIAISATAGAAAPDGTYAQRIFTRGDVFTADVDQVGSTVAGSNLTALVTVEQYQRPLQPFIGLTVIG